MKPVAKSKKPATKPKGPTKMAPLPPKAAAKPKSQSAKVAEKRSIAKATPAKGTPTPRPRAMAPPSMPKHMNARSATVKVPQEIDPSNLAPEDARKRVALIYQLEKVIERKRAIHDVAKRGAAVAKTALKDAEEALSKEIHDQRFGPGPLFSPDGKSAAKP